MAIAKFTASASQPLPQWVKRIQDHCQQLKKQYQAIADQADMKMIDSVQARVTRLDQEVQHLINCCNS
jgi:light-regulated signal transduction histidine kinase (bacteriophytochrome)